jgi:predicted MarR family transcription regulator
MMTEEGRGRWLVECIAERIVRGDGSLESLLVATKECYSIFADVLMT